MEKEEQILVGIAGQDRPGVTASVTEILAKYDAQILDIGQADIHSTLSLGILFRISEKMSGQVMKELLFKATELNINIDFKPVGDEEYEGWVEQQGKNRYILTVIGRSLSAKQIAAAAERDAPGEKRKGMHRVLAERHSERPRRHAVEADAPLGRHGVRLLAAEGQYVQENATADMLRHGLDTHTDRVYRRTG